MWRLANFIFRAFRTVGTYHCPQDLVIPLATATNKDEEKNEDVLTQFSPQNVEKLQEYLQKISYQQLNFQATNVIDYHSKELPPPPPSLEQEDTLDSLLQADEAYMSALQSLTDLNNETMSIINNQLALEAIEAGDTKSGIETLQISTTTESPNATALYNLGICYERGIGVESDRAKACDYYRQAAIRDHHGAQLKLTHLSNRLDTNENERFRFSFVENNQDNWNDYHVNLPKTLVCFS